MKFFAFDLVLTLIAATETRVRAHFAKKNVTAITIPYTETFPAFYVLLLNCLPIQIIDGFTFTKNELAMSFASWLDDDLVRRQSLRLGRNIQGVDWFILRLVASRNRRTGS
jgi:hypothetical protein